MVVNSSEKGSNYSADSISSRDADIVLREKKRGRKPKGNNVPGAKSLSKMSATSMDDVDGDMLERPDFQRITKDTWTGKKRKLQQCPLHDSLTSYQRTAVEERTQLFSAIPGKIMAETLLALDEASSAQRKTSTMRGDFRRRIIVGIEVAKQAVQRLAATAAEVLVRAQESVDTADGRYRHLSEKWKHLKYK